MAMAVIVAALLSSCEKEKDFNGYTPLGENSVAFVINNSSTRSSDATVPVKAGMMIKLDDAVCLEETIEELDYASPATKGAPAYTFNVGKIYKTMGVYGEYKDGDVYTEGDFGSADFVTMDTTMYANPNGGEGWRYHHNYPKSPWPDDSTPVDFYLSMPAGATGVTGQEYADGQINFTFDSPTNGAAQQDIIFGKTTLTKKQHDGYLPKGAPVMMYHALTGVKFRNGHTNDGSTKTVITKVAFKGLKSHGVCTVTPDGDTKVEWEGLESSKTFTLDFNNPTYVPTDGANNPDGTVDFGATDSQYAGTSWTTAAADHNLNDEDGSLTFWFIPQQIDEDVTLEITFLVKTPDTPDGTEVPHIIEFGKLVTQTTGEGDSAEKTYTEWKAGQLRTYTLKPFDVDVEIFDKMNDLTKDSLHVTNTGNVDEYVRIMIIGNWYGWKPGQPRTEEPSIMVGYQYVSEEAAKADGHPEDPMVRPWFREDALYSQGFDNTFTGGRPVASSKWKRGTGSYFYYTEKIGPGKQLSGTDAVFQHYELDESYIPTIYIPVSNQTTRAEAVGVHLVMEVVVQAVPNTVNGEEVDCWTAWSYAVGKEIKAK